MEINKTYNENDFFNLMMIHLNLIITRKRSVFKVVESLGNINTYNKNDFTSFLLNKYKLRVNIECGLFKKCKYKITGIYSDSLLEEVNSPPVSPLSSIGNPLEDNIGFTLPSSDFLDNYDYSDSNPLNLDEKSLISREICIQSSKVNINKRVPYINIEDNHYNIKDEYCTNYITVYGDDSKNTAVYYLAFRGTKINDISDIKADYDIFKNGIYNLPKAYAGEKFGDPPHINNVLHKRIYEGIITICKILKKVDNCDIILTGHSLGGIIAFILMRYHRGGDGINKPWTTMINGKEKSWIYDMSIKAIIHSDDFKNKIFNTNFECITFNTAAPSITAKLYDSIKCSQNNEISEDWCNKTKHHIIIGDEIPANLYEVVDKINNDYIKLYITGSINNKLKRHKIKNFRCKFSDGSELKPCMGLTADSKNIYVKGQLKKNKRKTNKKKRGNRKNKNKSKKSKRKKSKNKKSKSNQSKSKKFNKKTNKRTRRISK